MAGHTIEDLIKQLLADVEKNPASVGPIIETLTSHTDEGMLIDPLQELSTRQTWEKVFAYLLKGRHPHQASQVVLAWYERLNELQAKNGKRYHKGAVSHHAGVCFFNQGEFGRAVWFYICAYVEDILSSGNGIVPETEGTRNLHRGFGWGNERFENIASIAREMKAEGNELSWFPETAIVRLARDGKLRMPLPKSESCIPINRTFLKHLIERLPVGSNDDKKKSLEFLASYLAITLPGVRIKTNAKAFEQGGGYEHEIDLVATQRGSAPTYLLEALGRHFLIECKNGGNKPKPVGAADLNHFVAKMRFHRCKCGVIFSPAGLSGEHDNRGVRFAHITQLRWYQQDDCVVIVVKKEHLDELASGSFGSFAEVLLDGYESVRFSTTEDMFNEHAD